MDSVGNATKEYILVSSHAIQPRKGRMTAALKIATYVSYALLKPDR
jgi:hypothetical protein